MQQKLCFASPETLLDVIHKIKQKFKNNPTNVFNNKKLSQEIKAAQNTEQLNSAILKAFFS